MLKNSPNDWFTTDFQTFMQTQKLSNTNAYTEINAKDFDQWILNTKVKYLVVEELKSDQNLPPINSELDIFIQGCLKVLQNHFKCSIKSPDLSQ